MTWPSDIFWTRLTLYSQPRRYSEASPLNSGILMTTAPFTQLSINALFYDQPNMAQHFRQAVLNL